MGYEKQHDLSTEVGRMRAVLDGATLQREDGGLVWQYAVIDSRVMRRCSGKCRSGDWSEWQACYGLHVSGTWTIVPPEPTLWGKRGLSTEAQQWTDWQPIDAADVRKALEDGAEVRNERWFQWRLNGGRAEWRSCGGDWHDADDLLGYSRFEARFQLTDQRVEITDAVRKALAESGPATLADWAEHVHAVAKSKGWHDEIAVYSEGRIATARIGTWVALAHSELSEAMEELRKADTVDQLRMRIENGKPEGFVVEMADTIIRIFDSCRALGLDVAEAIEVKSRYNESRPQRHGGKRC